MDKPQRLHSKNHNKMEESLFSALGLSNGLCKVLADNGIEVPTDIQKLAIPPAVSGQDIIGIAPTGTGKTLAYLLPIFQEIRKSKDGFLKGPIGLVVTPSRELAAQVADVARILTDNNEVLSVVCIYGGAGTKSQKQLLANHPCLVVGTPGRIRELYSSQDLILKAVRFLVLDEADRLMDMGFTPQLRAMLEILPQKRQTFLFSATFNTRVEEATAEFLEWPVKVQAAKQATVPNTIVEHFIRTQNRATKFNLLEYFIKANTEGQGSGFIFCRTRQEANQVVYHLKERQILADVLHANKGQNTRQAALDAFKEGQVPWLVTTDVSARGLDVAAVPQVIQFGLPLDIRDYIHRTGRTGRAGVSGISYTFLDPADEARISPLQKLIGSVVRIEEPPETTIEKSTPKEEQIEYERAKDEVRRALDPTFKGAFHEKAARTTATTNKTQSPQSGAKKSRLKPVNKGNQAAKEKAIARRKRK